MLAWPGLSDSAVSITTNICSPVFFIRWPRICPAVGADILASYCFPGFLSLRAVNRFCTDARICSAVTCSALWTDAPVFSNSSICRAAGVNFPFFIWSLENNSRKMTSSFPTIPGDMPGAALVCSSRCGTEVAGPAVTPLAAMRQCWLADRPPLEHRLRKLPYPLSVRSRNMCPCHKNLNPLLSRRFPYPKRN